MFRITKDNVEYLGIGSRKYYDTKPNRNILKSLYFSGGKTTRKIKRMLLRAYW